MRLKRIAVIVLITTLAIIVTDLYWKYSKREVKDEVIEQKQSPHQHKIDTGTRYSSKSRQLQIAPNNLISKTESRKASRPPNNLLSKVESNKDSQFELPSEDERSRHSPVNLISKVREHQTVPQSNIGDFPSHNFEIRASFTLPMPNVTLPIHELIQQQWVENLRKYLHKIPPNSSKRSLITIVSCDLKFKGMLLNWLTSALLAVQPPLGNNILLLTLDQPLHKLMTEHGFDSLYAEGKELIQSSRIKYVQTHSRTPKLPLVMVWRLTMMRLLNHWGYDVANYDTDAIILKNTEQLFYEEFRNSHFIGSRANFPDRTSKVYGLTMCGGLFMIKSSPGTG